MAPCGTTLCGTVIWASSKQQAKARKAGTEQLVGRQLFRELKQVQAGVWSGRVFVPQLGKTVSGTMTAVSPKAIVGRGCIAGVVCKSQTWTRIS